mmetsp:Transcript_39827/g.86833  ORF Transcript_39827/g.86833 Transcript_39827/m.86833 type:complete len:440 (+) Transcript_39827:188-1507(+)
MDIVNNAISLISWEHFVSCVTSAHLFEHGFFSDLALDGLVLLGARDEIVVAEVAEDADQSAHELDFLFDDGFLVEVLVDLVHDVALELVLLVLGQFVVGPAQQDLHDGGDVLGQEGNAPVEHVHDVGEHLGLLALALLLDFDVGALEFEDGALVALVAALIRGREDGDHLGEDLVVVLQVELVEFESVELGFVGADQTLEFVVLEELARHGLALLLTAAAHVVGCPGVDVAGFVVFDHAAFVFVVFLVNRVRPEDVTEQALLGRLAEPVEFVDFLQTHFGGDAPVDDQEFVEQAAEGQSVETLHELVIDFGVLELLRLAFEVEVGAHGARLVVAAQHEEVLGLLDLVGHEQGHHLQRLFAAVDLVAQEELVGLGREAALLEQPDQVHVLPVRVPAHVDGGLHFHKDWLLSEDGLTQSYQSIYFVNIQVYIFSWFLGPCI